MPTSATPAEIRRDFDAISRLTPEGDHAGPYEEWLLANLPARRANVLELGCGVGSLARKLAARFETVDAVDFSESMIAEARRRTRERVDYACADLFDWLRDHEQSYDCIVSMATLHHVDLPAALRAMAGALRPGGRMLVIDLEQRDGLVANGIAWIAARLHELRDFRAMPPLKLRRAYWHHGRNETYLRHDEVLAAAAQLPGAQVRSHLMWRYTLLWDKP